MARIKINDLAADQSVSEEEMNKVLGGNLTFMSSTFFHNDTKEGGEYYVIPSFDKYHRMTRGTDSQSWEGYVSSGDNIKTFST